MAVSTVVAPTATEVLAAGAVSATVGAVTLTLATDEVAIEPFESVTRALTAKIPLVVGVQLAVYGAVNAVPTTVEATRKSTRATVALPAAVAVAENTGLVPSAIVAAFAGAVSVTASAPGAEATLTLTAAEVTTVPMESVARAVRATVPEAAGVQLTE